MKRSTFGWVEILLGILMVILGIYTIANPLTALAGIVIAYAIVAIISGIADFVIYARLERRGGFGSGMMIVSGILNILVGVLLLFNVGAGTWALTILFPIWFIIHCISRLMNIDVLKAFGSTFTYWIVLIANVLGVIFGIVMLFFNPALSMATIALFVTLYLIVSGVASLVGGIGTLSRGN